MSFAKSQRFQKTKDVTPAVGHYDLSVNSNTNARKNVIFDKSERFMSKELDGTSLNPSSCSSFRDRLFCHSTPNLSTKKCSFKKRNNATTTDSDHTTQLVLNLEASLTEENDTNTELEQRLVSVAEELRLCREAYQQLQTVHETLEMKNKSLSQSLKDVKAENVDNGEFIRHLKGEVFAYRDTSDGDRQTLFELTAERALLLEKIQETKDAELTLHTNIKALTDKYQTFEALYNGERDSNMEKLATLTCELDLTKGKLTDERKHMSAVELMNHQLHEDVLTIQSSKDKLTQDLTLATVKNSCLEREIHEKQSAIEDVTVQHNELLKVDCEIREVVEELQLETEKLKKCVDDKDLLMEELKQSKALLDGVIVEKVKEMEIVNEQLEDVKRLLDEQKSCISRLEGEKTKLLRSLEERQITLEQVMVERESLLKEVDEKVEEMKELKDEIIRVKLCIDERDKLCDDLQMKVDGLVMATDESKVVMCELVCEKNAMEVSVKEKSDELRIVQTEKDLLLKSYNEVDGELGELKQAKHDLKEKLSNAEHELVKVASEKDLMICNMGREVSKKEKDIMQLVVNLERKNVEVCNLKEDMKLYTLSLASKDEEYERIQMKCEELTSSLQTLASNHANLQLDFDSYKCVNDKAEADYTIELETLTFDNLSKTTELHKSTEHVSQLNKTIELLQAKVGGLKQSVGEKDQEIKQLRGQSIDLVTRGKSNHMKLEFMSDKLTLCQNKLTSCGEETLRWKEKYSELETMIEPFREQLTAFEDEKNFLLGKSQDAQHEIATLGKNYAQILGHQNNKQKIKHIINMKEDQNRLKDEVCKLRKELDKMRRQNRLLDEKVASNEGRRRFDTSKVFNSTKENISCNESRLSIKSKSVSGFMPLKEGNRQ